MNEGIVRFLFVCNAHITYIYVGSHWHVTRVCTRNIPPPRLCDPIPPSLVVSLLVPHTPIHLPVTYTVFIFSALSKINIEKIDMLSNKIFAIIYWFGLVRLTLANSLSRNNIKMLPEFNNSILVLYFNFIV